ncbi:MAG: 3-oxoacyl-ACP reductase FabG [Firmicutes bacterium]|nr:3-oxoacyl-ACP reductase FabG [Bacillota bacterium]
MGAGSGQLAGQVAIVTGASRGIGRAVALALAQEGAQVAINYREQAKAAHEVAAAIREMGSDAISIRADVRREADCRELVETAVARWGKVDILVNNAGTALHRLLIDTTPSEWETVMAVHLGGAFHCTRAALPYMIRAGRGRIINMSSVWGQVGAANEVAYSTAKAGLIGFTRALAKEVARAGITVNAVAPGVIETDMLGELSEEERAQLAESLPLGRLGRPQDAAAAVVFLASPAAAYVTGQVICPNGGMAM